MAIKNKRLKLYRGATYTFDVSNSNLASHPLKFSADSGSTEYTDGVTLTGTQGQNGATITFVVPANAPDNMNYYCGTHGLGMGNHILITGVVADPESDGSFFSPYRSHFNITAASGTLYTSGTGTVFYAAIDEGVPPTNESDGSFFIDSDITVTTDSDIQYGGGYGLVFNIIKKEPVWYGDRAVYAGAIFQGSGDDIGYFDITTLGNATGFGNLLSTHASGGHSALSNGTKALFAGGPRSSLRTDDIEVITISTPAEATDFGDLLAANSVMDGIHSGAYGFYSGGDTGSYTDVVQTVIVDTPGNASSFGTLQTGVSQNGNVTDNSRIVRGGNSGASDYQLQYWSNASMTTAQDFGDWAAGTGIAGTAVGAGDRGIFWGRTYNDYTDIEYISIQTPGNAVAFGNLLTNQTNNNGYGTYFSGSANNATRGTIFGGITTSGSNEIQYITMDTLGDGQDFGDLQYRSTYTCGASGAAA